MRPTTFTPVALLVAALLIAGCGLTGEGEAPERTSEEVAAQASDAETGETSDADSAEASDAEGAEVPSGPLATRRGQIDGEAVILELTELKRSGDTTALNIRLGVPRETDSSIGAQVSQTFDDGIGELDDGDGGDSSTLDGISLIDSQNRQRYLVARDANGTCVCDGNLSSAFIEFKAPVVLSATFGAPPEDVDTVDVVIPQFGTFKDVPLS